MRRIALVLVILFVLWDAFLHVTQLLTVTGHFWFARFYLQFPNLVIYNLFWSVAWFIVTLTLIWILRGELKWH